MKKITLFIGALFVASTLLNAQESENTWVTKNDTTTIKTSKKLITIINLDKDSKEAKSDTMIKKSKQRYNHFAGIDLGVNGFMSNNESFDLQNDAQFMDLDYAKSWSVAINFYEVYIPIAKEKLGISTGLGIEFNNYFLNRNVTLFSDPDTLIGVMDASKNIGKNRLKTTMLNLPLFIETNIGRDAKHSFHLAVGGMVSYRMGSKTKQIFTQSNEEYKVKNRTDFNMNPFRFNAVARVGYGDFTLFAAYSLTSMFEKDKGPEIYPFTVGLSIATW